MNTVKDQHVSVRWINFAGEGAEQVAKKLGITFNDLLLISLEDWVAFQELVFDERENDRAIRMRNF